MATIFARNKKTTSAIAPIDPSRTVKEYRADQSTADGIQTLLADMRPKLKALELEREAVDEQIGDILARKLMGERVSVDTLQGLESQKTANTEEYERVRLSVDGLEARLQAFKDQENARQAAIWREKLVDLGADVRATEQVLFDKLIELGDTYDAMFAARKAFAEADREHSRYSPNKGHGIQGPRNPLFVIPQQYMLRGPVWPHTDTLADQVRRWIAEPEKRAEARRADHLKAAAEHDRLRKIEEAERERVRREREAIRARGGVVIDPITGRTILD